MLLNILQCIGQPPTERISLPQISIMFRLRNAALDSGAVSPYHDRRWNGHRQVGLLAPDHPASNTRARFKAQPAQNPWGLSRFIRFAFSCSHSSTAYDITRVFTLQFLKRKTGQKRLLDLSNIKIFQVPFVQSIKESSPTSFNPWLNIYQTSLPGFRLKSYSISVGGMINMITGGWKILPEKMWSNVEVMTCWAYLPRSQCVTGSNRMEQSQVAMPAVGRIKSHRCTQSKPLHGRWLLGL